jgi:hypothetical protein
LVIRSFHFITRSGVGHTKRATRLLCRPPDILDVRQTAFLARLLEPPTVELTYSLTQRFVRLVCDRQEADLTFWLADALTSTFPA